MDPNIPSRPLALPDKYIFDTAFGRSEIRLDGKERAFAAWAEDQGYEKHDAYLVLAACGEDGDVPCDLHDAWPVWDAAWDAAGIDKEIVRELRK